MGETTALRGLASIEPDKRGFWHVNFWEPAPEEEGVPCDAFKTTQIGAPLDEVRAFLAMFNPWNLAIDGERDAG